MQTLTEVIVLKIGFIITPITQKHSECVVHRLECQLSLNTNSACLSDVLKALSIRNAGTNRRWYSHLRINQMTWIVPQITPEWRLSEIGYDVTL